MDVHCYCMQVSASTIVSMPYSLLLIHLKIPQDFSLFSLIGVYQIFESSAFTCFWEIIFLRGKNVTHLAHPIDKNNTCFR